MNAGVEIIVSVSLIVGAFFALVGSIGLFRLPDFFSRLHGPTKATTLGVGGVLIASAVFTTASGEGVSVHELLILGFLFMTAPVSAHMLAKAALHLDLSSGLAHRPDPTDLAPSLPTGAAHATAPDAGPRTHAADVPKRESRS